MDKDVTAVGGFLVLMFLFSFAFHVLYAEGKAVEWFVAGHVEKEQGHHEGDGKKEDHHEEKRH